MCKRAEPHWGETAPVTSMGCPACQGSGWPQLRLVFGWETSLHSGDLPHCPAPLPGSSHPGLLRESLLLVCWAARVGPVGWGGGLSYSSQRQKGSLKQGLSPLPSSLPLPGFPLTRQALCAPNPHAPVSSCVPRSLSPQPYLSPAATVDSPAAQAPPPASPCRSGCCVLPPPFPSSFPLPPPSPLLPSRL